MSKQAPKQARTTPAATPKLYKCNANPAHQWMGLSSIENEITLTLGIAGKIENLCPHCLSAKLQNLLKGVGRVEIVNDGSD